jgi:hypothetical protein
VLIAPEHATVADVFKAMLVDHDGDEIRLDLQRRDKGVRELFDNFAFLFRCPAFANFEYYYGHGNSLKYDMGTDDIYSLPRPIRLHNAGGTPFLRTRIFYYCAPIAA